VLEGRRLSVGKGRDVKGAEGRMVRSARARSAARHGGTRSARVQERSPLEVL